ITIGASTTAMYYVSLKMVRNEESYIIKSFFKSFKENFIQATVMWIIDIIVFGLIIIDLLILDGRLEGFAVPGGSFATVFKVAVIAVGIILLFIFVFSFPVLAKFDNTIKNTYKNSFFMSIRHFPTTILSIFLWGVSFAALIFYPELGIFYVMLVFSVIAYVTSKLFVKNFDKYIPEEESVITSDMDWHVGNEEQGELKENVSNEEGNRIQD
nr:DUF624 domain-containing protein [Lachnospiraceae bacterium]